MMATRGWTRVAAAVAVCSLWGCAKFPDTGGADSGTSLVFRMELDGTLRTGLEPGESGLPYVYIIALYVSTEEDPIVDGPLPVVVPSGNGFVAGEATHYILWNPLASPAYQIWQFADEDLNESFQTGTPINYVPVDGESSFLQFEVNLDQLVPETQVDDIESVIVNFLTMNNTNVSGGGRLWDALGDSENVVEVNSPQRILLRGSQLYNDQLSGNLEPVGDVVDPDLDISNWSVEVRVR